MNFINIHTHHSSSLANVTSIYNNRVGQEPEMMDSFFSIGIHPWDINTVDEQTAFEIIKKNILNKNCLAIGECGLDKIKDTDFKGQQHLFEMQLQIAKEFRKPVIIHCVKAFDELLEITKPFISHIPLIIHGFHKSEQLANDLLAKGFYLSFNKLVLQDTNFNFNALPINQLFLETDDHANVSLELIYTTLAFKLNLPLEHLKEEINRNFETVFYGTKR